MSLDSTNIVTLYYYSTLLYTIGEFEASRKYINRAMEIDPYSARFRRASSYFFHEENKAKEALQEILMVEGMLGDQSAQQEYIFYCYLAAGDTLAALQLIQNFFATSKKYEQRRELANQVFPVYQSAGLKGVYKMMIRNPNEIYIAVQLDSLDLAIHYLEKEYENRSASMYYFVLSRDFVKLHNDPRFLEIADKTGLTPYFNLRYKK